MEEPRIGSQDRPGRSVSARIYEFACLTAKFDSHRLTGVDALGCADGADAAGSMEQLDGPQLCP
jgi:hypothetical protein